MKKAMIFLADGFEEIEALAVVDLLRRGSVETAMVSIMDSLTVTGRSGITVKADVMWEAADPADTDAFILPGGMPGTTHLMNHAGLRKLLADAAVEGRLVTAICAAPTVLADIGLLKGKKACCYPGLEEKLAGAETSCEEEVIRDGNIITSRGAGTAIPFGLAIIAALLGEEKADEIKKSIVYRH